MPCMHDIVEAAHLWLAQAGQDGPEVRGWQHATGRARGPRSRRPACARPTMARDRAPRVRSGYACASLPASVSATVPSLTLALPTRTAPRRRRRCFCWAAAARQAPRTTWSTRTPAAWRCRAGWTCTLRRSARTCQCAVWGWLCLCLVVRMLRWWQAGEQLALLRKRHAQSSALTCRSAPPGSA